MKDTNETFIQENTPKEKTVRIRIPRDRDDESDVFVSVNERTWQIKRGVETEVPACVAEVLSHSEDAREEEYRFRKGALAE